MHPIFQHLHRDHTRLSQVLDLMGRQLDFFHVGQQPELDLMIDVLDYLEKYADCIHHKSEDAIFERYLAGTGKHRALVEEVMGQHKGLVDMTRSFRRALEGIMQDAVQRRDEVEALGRDYLALQRRHLQLEDDELFPLVETALSDGELDSLQKDLPSGRDPLFDERLKDRYRMLVQYLSRAGG